MNSIAHASPAPPGGPQLDNRRVLAGVIDLVVLAAGLVAVGAIAGVLLGGGLRTTAALDVVFLGWALYYYFACESGNGQTLGKRVMKLRVVRADGSQAGTREIVVRTVLRVVDGLGLYLVGLIVMIATGKRRQRLGDLAAGTVVVDASTPVVPAGAPPAEAAGVPEQAPERPEGVTVAPAPVAEEPSPLPAAAEVVSPALSELGEDVARAASGEERPVTEDEPPVAEEEEPVADEEHPVIRSVETVSAIDLVMGDEPQPQR